jgi:EAL domain-containing protein (putative c-di-GMP-specific phosphodiesterase class I)
MQGHDDERAPHDGEREAEQQTGGGGAGNDGEPKAGQPAAARGAEERASERIVLQARANLRNLVSDDTLALPSLRLIADGIRLELEKRGEVAILYVGLKRYGRLERVFGWQVTSDVLDACSSILQEMVGTSLRKLDVLADFTLSDNAFIVVLSPPRRAKEIARDDLMAISRRVYERLQSMLLNDLAPGVFDRVHPFVTVAVLQGDADLTFEQSLQNGVAAAMQAAEREWLIYDDELERTLADAVANHSLEPLFQPVVDVAARRVLGYHTAIRGPFYSPLRLPDVLDEVARRSALLPSYGIETRELAVTKAVGLAPDELLMLSCESVELPGAAVLALSEFYSLNTALVPQHVVFEIQVADLAANAASALRVLGPVHEMGFSVCVAGVGSGLTAFDLITRAQPDYLALDPVISAGAAGDPTFTDIVQLLLRFAARIDARLIAPEVADVRQMKALRRVGVELMSGAVFARPDTRLPKLGPAKLVTPE